MDGARALGRMVHDAYRWPLRVVRRGAVDGDGRGDGCLVYQTASVALVWSFFLSLYLFSGLGVPFDSIRSANLHFYCRMNPVWLCRRAMDGGVCSCATQHCLHANSLFCDGCMG